MMFRGCVELAVASVRPSRRPASRHRVACHQLRQTFLEFSVAGAGGRHWPLFSEFSVTVAGRSGRHDVLWSRRWRVNGHNPPLG